MRQILLFLTISGTLFGQSMLEAGAVVAGTTVGGAAGKQVSQGIDKTFRKADKILDAAAKADEKKAGNKKVKEAAVPAKAPTPALRVSAGVPKAEANNVPPPPPLVRKTPARPARTPVAVPIVMSAVIPREEPAFQVNVDLAAILPGMLRDSVLALGPPSARITMYEDGHLLEIYQYRNQTLASGTVRLRDGAVATVATRP